MAQDEERDRRKRSGKRQATLTTTVASGSDVGGPGTSKSHQKTTARFPLIVTRKVTTKNGDEEGYETDHQDYCEVCQQVTSTSG